MHVPDPFVTAIRWYECAGNGGFRTLATMCGRLRDRFDDRSVQPVESPVCLAIAATRHNVRWIESRESTPCLEKLSLTPMPPATSSTRPSPNSRLKYCR